MNTEQIRFRIYLGLFILLLLSGILGFMTLEDLSLVDSICFSIVTMATVGYGDIHPQTGSGKILALVMIVGGVSTFLGVVASIWKKEDFIGAEKALKQLKFIIDLNRGSLFEIREYLQKQATLLLRLIENPIIHEHENFTGLLRAIFHLRDRLMNGYAISFI